MVYVNTFLGVLIDHKLNWKQHIKMITSKLSKTIAIMNRTKYILDKNARLILYYSLFLPYMSYCCEVWGNTYKSNIECMYLLQKKVVRIDCGVGYREHTNELFSELLQCLPQSRFSKCSSQEGDLLRTCSNLFCDRILYIL